MELIQVVIILFLIFNCCHSFRFPFWSTESTTTTTTSPSLENMTSTTISPNNGSDSDQVSWETEDLEERDHPIDNEDDEDREPLFFHRRIRRARILPASETKTGNHAKHRSGHLKMLMKLIEVGHLNDCAGRVICDLNCDPSRFGPSGKKVLDLMNRFETASSVPLNSVHFLVSAGLSGKMYYWTATCDRCKQVYPDCFAESDELIDVASIFDVGI